LEKWDKEKEEIWQKNDDGQLKSMRKGYGREEGKR
jgi:hypothetical protein